MNILGWIDKYYCGWGLEDKSQQVTLKDDEVVVFKKKGHNGGYIALSRVNIFGGTCDDCSDGDLLKTEISNWRKQRVAWNTPKAGKHSINSASADEE